MTLRLAKYSDITQCLELGETFWKVTPYKHTMPFPQSGVLGLMTGLVQARLMLVVEQDDKIVGMGAIIVAPFPFDPTVTTAQELFWYVLPDYRNKGSGERMLQALEDLARERGATIFNMGSHGNESAELLLDDNGYTPTETFYTKVL